MLVAMVVAVRQALDYQSTLRALAVCAIGFPVYALGLLVSILFLGPWPI
jgi:formate hydrogenlyase subunit 4